MAPSFANAKLFSAIVIDGFSNSLTRRGYAAASAAATQSGATRKGGVGVVSTKSGENKGDSSSSSSSKVSWVPDPVTGYYKPENIKEIDVADLRATLLAKKFNN